MVPAAVIPGQVAQGLMAGSEELPVRHPAIRCCQWSNFMLLWIVFLPGNSYWYSIIFVFHPIWSLSITLAIGSQTLKISHKFPESTILEMELCICLWSWHYSHFQCCSKNNDGGHEIIPLNSLFWEAICQDWNAWIHSKKTDNFLWVFNILWAKIPSFWCLLFSFFFFFFNARL